MSKISGESDTIRFAVGSSNAARSAVWRLWVQGDDVYLGTRDLSRCGTCQQVPQPDKHSLVVRDSDGVEVLNIKFINPKVIRITGRFQLSKGSEPVVISPDQGIRWPGGGGISNLTLNVRGNGGLIDFSKLS